jgi:5-formyltetrahydrofolate cyclo-ligase
MTFRIVADLERDLAPGRFGIAEPKAYCPELAESKINLLFVPGLGFDAAGNRLGYGKGYCVRYLARSTQHIRIGIAYEACILSYIPIGENDQQMAYVITEERCIMANS